MSLAQHVTAIEGIDREPDESLLPDVEGDEVDDEMSQVGMWRTLSHDPFIPPEHTTIDELVETPTLAAYNVSPAWRIAQIAFAVIFCCLASGMVFGYASLKPILVSEGIYGDLCESRPSKKVACPDQEIHLNLFFTAASITTNISSLLAGYTLDRWGRRVCYIVSSVFIAIGSLWLGLAFSKVDFDNYTVGNIFLGLGGTFLFVPSYQLANAFPRYSGLIVASITGAFDASSAVYLVYRLIWDNTGGAFTPSQFHYGFTIVPILLHFGEWTIMPSHAYQTTPEIENKLVEAKDHTNDLHDSDAEVDSPTTLIGIRRRRADDRIGALHKLEDLVGDEEEREDRAHQIEEQHNTSGIWGVLHGLPASQQMLTPWFILLLLLVVLQMLRMNYFIATVRGQYVHLLKSEDLGEKVNIFFDFALPIGGVAATPFIGMLLNNMSVATVLVVLTVYIAVIGVLNCLPYLWAGYLTVLAFCLFRPLFYSAVTDYLTKVFGFATFGRMYGTITAISGMVNFAQPGLDAITQHYQKNPVPVNIAFAILGTLVGVSLSGFVMYSSARFQKQETIVAERQAASETTPLLSQPVPPRITIIKEPEDNRPHEVHHYPNGNGNGNGNGN